MKATDIDIELENIILPIFASDLITCLKTGRSSGNFIRTDSSARKHHCGKRG